MMSELFNPVNIAGLELKNRWAMAPMTRRRSPDGIPTTEVAEHYEKRAAGGIGLIITEGVVLDHPNACDSTLVPTLKEETLNGWGAVVQRCHRHGTRVFPQIWHLGPVVRHGVAALSIIEDGEELVREATAQDKKALLQAYSQAAANARKAGFDGLELHGAHGYLLDSFLRKGDLAFAAEIIRETRLQTGPDFPISLRFSNFKVNDFTARYLDSPQDLEKLIKAVVNAGVDILHPSTRRFWLPEFDGSPLGLAGWTRKISGMPTIVVGNIGLETPKLISDGPESLQNLDKKLQEGEFDLAAVGRPVITDPEWVNKVQAGNFKQIKDFYEESIDELYP